MEQLELHARQDVQTALAEDLGAGDLLADLVTTDNGTADLISRSSGVLAGCAWADAALAATCAGSDHALAWQLEEGATFAADTVLAKLSGPIAGILAAERVMLNFLQLMCATASAAAAVAQAAAPVPVYDTRKTLPKLRAAQKHAVTVGGMLRNRASLAEAIIIKDNHIAAVGSVAAAFEYACGRCEPEQIQVEVADLAQLDEALAAGVSRIMLDNFSPELATEAVAKIGKAEIELEASGGITAATAAAYAATGVARLSCGSVTKDVAAVDLSIQLTP